MACGVRRVGVKAVLQVLRLCSYAVFKLYKLRKLHDLHNLHDLHLHDLNDSAEAGLRLRQLADPQPAGLARLQDCMTARQCIIGRQARGTLESKNVDNLSRDLGK